MKIRNAQYRNAQAFTLIEMIGVLAVIAILASLLIPKVFEAINNSRINNAAVSYNTVKAAVADHYAKFGSILSSNGVAIATIDAGAINFDKTLLQEGFLDKPFVVKIGDATAHVAVTNALAAATVATPSNDAYDLDGTGTANDAVGGVVIQAIIPGVTENDAKDLNDRLDGATLGSGIGTNDVSGRVKYATASPTTTVRIYVTHR